jgi:hypothetical protein
VYSYHRFFVCQCGIYCRPITTSAAFISVSMRESGLCGTGERAMMETAGDASLESRPC